MLSVFRVVHFLFVRRPIGEEALEKLAFEPSKNRHIATFGLRNIAKVQYKLPLFLDQNPGLVVLSDH